MSTRPDPVPTVRAAVVLISVLKVPSAILVGRGAAVAMPLVQAVVVRN